VGVAGHWGATPAEQTEPLPCDPLLPAASSRLHRAVSVRAPVELLYRWVCQLSVAPYSYDWIDNRGRPSPRDLVPGSDTLRVGQRFMIILRLAAFKRDDHLTLVNRRTAVTYATRPTPGGSRLLVRMLFAPPGGPGRRRHARGPAGGRGSRDDAPPASQPQAVGA